MKKSILGICLMMILCFVLTGCGKSGLFSDEYWGENRQVHPDRVAFVCEHYVDSGADGGFYGTKYYCVVADGDITIYAVSENTTADNGSTLKYVIHDTSLVNVMLDEVRSEDWRSLFGRCKQLVQAAGSGEIVSGGMNDDESRYENSGRYKWEDEYDSLVFGEVIDSSHKNDETKVLTYHNQYDTATVTLSHNGEKYYIEYEAVADDPEYADSFNSGPYGGEIDRSYYARLMDIVAYIDDNQEKFNEKAVKYSQLDMANPTDTLLMNFATSYLALSADEEYKDDFDKLRYEADSYLNDIEQIIAHGDASLEDYYIHDGIVSCEDETREGYIHDYYAEDDFNLKIVDYDKYVDMWKYYAGDTPLIYDNPDQDYAVRAILGFSSWVSLWVENYAVTDGVLNISMCYDENGVMADGGGVFMVMPVPKGTKLGTVNDHIPEYKFDPNYEMSEDKPVIYLYNYDGSVNVRLEPTDELFITHTYPKYEKNGWDVIASPDGTLTNGSDMTYRYLFWEGKSNHIWALSKGFCVKGEDTAEFLEEKLRDIGLNDVEINEFVIYWLPKMENNQYNVISFQTDAYDKFVPLKVTPEPDSVLRVFMTWRKSDVYLDMIPQEFPIFIRAGKTVVEWGGSEVFE